jgi:phosphatidylglycerol:prolipoprotein diacylglycerol transferase
MLRYPDIDPVALTLGPVSIHWYGITYLIGFAAFWALGRYRAGHPGCAWTAQMVDDALFYGVIGVIVGGRLGYMLFYGFDQILSDPVSLVRVWEGGMSFHGGLIGVMVAMWLFGRRRGMGFFQVTDFVAPLIPLGLLAGRLGNFINGELWGRATQLPWGVQLPCGRFPAYCAGTDGGWSPALHPSQLYEAALEGVLLFIILWLFSGRPRPTMAVSGLFLLCYGGFRFAVEFVRVPDAHLGYLAFDWITMGQVLSLPMILAGLLLLAMAYRRQPAGSGTGAAAARISGDKRRR